MAIRTGIIKFLCVACFRLAVILTIYAFHVPAILIVLII